MGRATFRITRAHMDKISIETFLKSRYAITCHNENSPTNLTDLSEWKPHSKNITTGMYCYNASVTCLYKNKLYISRLLRAKTIFILLFISVTKS
jgi:hypothetical protein